MTPAPSAAEPAVHPLPRRALALSLLLGTVAAAQDPVQGSDTAQATLELALEDALQIAVENNLGLDVERIVTEEALYNSLGSWGAFDPVLFLEGALTDRESPGVSDLSGANVLEEDSQDFTGRLTWPFQTGGSAQLQYTRSNDRTNNSFAAFDVSTTDVVTASLNQPLLRGGWKRFATANQREAEVNYQIQLERERETRQRLLLDVYNAYWDLVSAREELEVREFAVRLGREQQARDERRLEVGTGTEVDVLQTRTNVAQEVQNRIRALHALRTAEDNLRRLLLQKPKGDAEDFLREWDRPIVPTTPLPVVSEADGLAEHGWRSSLDRALGLRPELWQSRLEINAAEIRLGRARSEKLPQLDIDLSATGVGFNSDPDDAFSDAWKFEFPEYRGGLTFSIPIGNRTASYAERSARAAVRRNRLNYDQRELDILAEVRAALRDVTFQSESVIAAETSRVLAVRQLEAEEARLEIGLTTTFQVLEFQQDLAQALSEERAARAGYAKSWASLGFAEGSLEEEPPFVVPRDQ